MARRALLGRAAMAKEFAAQREAEAEKAIREAGLAEPIIFVGSALARLACVFYARSLLAAPRGARAGSPEELVCTPSTITMAVKGIMSSAPRRSWWKPRLPPESVSGWHCSLVGVGAWHWFGDLGAALECNLFAFLEKFKL